MIHKREKTQTSVAPSPLFNHRREERNSVPVESPFKVSEAKIKETTEETISPFKTVPAGKQAIEVKKERLYRTAE